MYEQGWELTSDLDGTTGDLVLGKSAMFQVQLAADAKVTIRVSVPVIWDKTRQTIISNESSEIIWMLSSAFDRVIRNTLDYCPKNLRSEIDSVNADVYDSVNIGVYKTGFAKSQEAYETAYHNLFDTLEWLEKHLAWGRYVCGDAITEADWRLYTTLVRFDAVYYGHFKCNKFRICDQPNLWNYLKDLYQQPGIAEITDMDGIKRGYWGNMENVNPSVHSIFIIL